MIPQLLNRLVKQGATKEDAAAMVLGADPLDLSLHMEQVWNTPNPWQFGTPTPKKPAGPAREKFWAFGQFDGTLPPATTGGPFWDHLGSSYVLENTRCIQVLRRVVREFRSGEGLGVPSIDTQRWLDATEALLFGAANPIANWLSTSVVRPDPESVRRNAYHRLLGLELSFGTDDNRPPAYDKASAANIGFIKLFEELLFEVGQAIWNLTNKVAGNPTDDDRIYRIAEQLRFVLRSRRQENLLAREELAAATALGWAELTVSADTPLVVDLRAQATSPSDRLKLIGQRVGLSTHSKSAQFFSMAADMSIFLRLIESGIVSGPAFSWVLYLSTPPKPGDPSPIGDSSRRLITEWAAATDKDLKVRAKPVETSSRRLVGAR